MVDRFLVRVAVDADGRFAVESDVPDSGTGIVASAARLVARELGLATLPISRLATSLIDDPSGTYLRRGRRPGHIQRAVYRLVEHFQKLGAALAISLTSKMAPARESWFLRAFARPLNAANALTNWLKLRLFPHSIDSYVPRTSGSRGMLMVGRAAVLAAARLREAAIAAAAEMLAVPTAALEVDGEGVRHRIRSDTRVSWGELARHRAGTLASVGDAQIPPGHLFDPSTGNQIGAFDHMFASHGCDVAVDRETGKVEILRYVACQDVGRALNVEAIRGQMIGSIAMGVAQALSEKIFVKDGAVANAALHDYLVPTSLDAPADPTIEILESEDGFGPHGAKGCGEAGAVASPIAVANALYDALGVQLDIPATPEDVLGALARRGR
jgi:CO/xanthine dehydrogenase Mo-binding subunit